MNPAGKFRSPPTASVGVFDSVSVTGQVVVEPTTSVPGPDTTGVPVQVPPEVFNDAPDGIDTVPALLNGTDKLAVPPLTTLMVAPASFTNASPGDPSLVVIEDPSAKFTVFAFSNTAPLLRVRLVHGPAIDITPRFTNRRPLSPAFAKQDPPTVEKPLVASVNVPEPAMPALAESCSEPMVVLLPSVGVPLSMQTLSALPGTRLALQLLAVIQLLLVVPVHVLVQTCTIDRSAVPGSDRCPRALVA